MIDILSLNEEKILQLEQSQIDRPFTTKEIIHIADRLYAHWKYDYTSKYKPNFHALLKGSEHSDEFFYSDVFLASPNIMKIMAMQLVRLFNESGLPIPNWIVGIPKGAKELGDEVAKILQTKSAVLEKKENKEMVLISDIVEGDSVLMVDDFSSAGTAIRDAVKAILAKTKVCFIPFVLFVLNRRETDKISTIAGDFIIRSLAKRRVNQWLAPECPLCKMGSIPIKPKNPSKNWNLLLHQSLLTLLPPLTEIHNKYERIKTCQDCVWEQWCKDSGHPDTFPLGNGHSILMCVTAIRDRLILFGNPAKL